MCGIAGIVSEIGIEQPAQKLKLMADALRHRGPDGEGYWQNDEQTVGFAHRRLSIVDLTAAAAQPLHYLHYTIIFNGEIYNYVELRQILQKAGYAFTSTGDTEVLVAAYQHWGFEFLQQLDGMFSLAIYDKKSKTVFIARDRFGEKPLYYFGGKQKGSPKTFYFASEMKALWAIGVPKQANNTMLLNYITLGYVQNPANSNSTFYDDIYSLPPGHWLQLHPDLKIEIQQWYKPKERIAALAQKQHNEKEIIDRFSDLFFISVRRRLRSDVPVGTSLSGGLDSSAVVAAIDHIRRDHGTLAGWANVCFSAIFPGFEKDESGYSKQVAETFNITQHTITPTAGDWQTNWDILLHHQEEPMQSSSVLTQYMVYGLAKEKNITVLLDGQGADEVLAGYKKYSHWYLQQLFRSNYSLYKTEKRLLLRNDLMYEWGLKNVVASFLPETTAKQLEKKAYRQQIHHPFLNTDFLLAHHNNDTLQKPVVHVLEDMLAYNTFTVGLQELLRYADRNSMAHSREVRLPFLYHELVEFIFSLPSNYKIREGFTKWVLRQSMDKLLPKNIVWRTGKVGFEPPQQQWMQQAPIQELIRTGRETLVHNGILNPGILLEPIGAKPAHDAQNNDWRYLCAAGMFAPSAKAV